MSNFVQGETITLYTNYTDSNSTPIISGVSGNSISIYYYTGVSRVYQVSGAPMIQDTMALQRFIYPYSIPWNAAITNYIADYTAMYSGTILNSTDNFSVINPYANPGIYFGSVNVSGTIVDISGTGIAGASVKVSSYTGASVLTSTVTNASGIYNVYVNPDNFYMQVYAAGYNQNTVAETVPTGVTTFFWGNTTLVGGGIGTITLQDTASYFDPTSQSQYPLVNCKVSLYSRQGSTTLVNPIAQTRTDSTGAFVMNASAGEYVLRFEGNGVNNTVYDTAYDIEVSDAFNTELPLGFRYEGASQYSFL